MSNRKVESNSKGTFNTNNKKGQFNGNKANNNVQQNKNTNNKDIQHNKNLNNDNKPITNNEVKRRTVNEDDEAPSQKKFKTVKHYSNTPERETIKLQRESLPVYQAKEQIMNEINANSSLIVVGETGSGKTTQIPQFLHEAGYSTQGCIAVTQPRRVAAITIAKRVAKEMGAPIGGLVGYTIRFEDVSSPATKIKYLTDGMLLREAMLDPLLKKYSVIVLDEAHERTLHTDILFAVIKDITYIICIASLYIFDDVEDVMRRRGDLKCIIMSATLEAQKFSGYFSAPVRVVEGRKHHVDILYSNEPQADYLDSAIITIFQIHFEMENGDILCFLTGREEIEDLEKLLEEKIQLLPPESQKMLVCPIFAALPPDQQLKVFEPAPPNTRKVILATNIAETSITINGIKYPIIMSNESLCSVMVIEYSVTEGIYVIDPGVVKTKSYNAKIGLDSLQVQPISKAAAMQRAGRAGRESSGTCFRLYTEYSFEALPESTIPEIQRSNLSNVVLQLKTIGIDDILGFDFMDKPPLEALKRALETLLSLGALDSKLALTSLGKKIAQLPLEPTYSKVVLTSMEMGVLRDMLSIVSMLSVESVFYTPRDKKLQAERARQRFFHEDGDHLAFLGVYQEFVKSGKSQQWCWDNFINPKSMKKVSDVRNQLVEYMTNMGTPPEVLTQGGAVPDSEKIRKCFVSGFARNAAQLQPDKKSYMTMIDHKLVYMHPQSVLITKKMPFVLFSELVLTTKEYMRNVMKIEQVWLTELAPAQYQKVKVLPDPKKAATNNTNNKAAVPKKNKFAHFGSMVDHRQ